MIPNQKYYQFVFIIIVLGLCFNSVAQLSAPVHFEHTGHYYAVDKECVTWTEAREYASGLTFAVPGTPYLWQGHLVTIQDSAEDNFVRWTYLGQWDLYLQSWLGAYRTSDAGSPADNWAWVTCEPWKYTNWDVNEPDHYEEDYARMLAFFDGRWHDFPDIADVPDYLYTIVEFEPPIYRSEGFLPPAKNGTIKMSWNRCLPLKAVLRDCDGKEIMGSDIEHPPKLVTTWLGPVEEPKKESKKEKESRDDAVYQCQSMTGNQFSYNGYHWQYNLFTRDCCTKPGRYSAEMKSGDSLEYSILPGTSVIFEVK
jgi:hypothetical protein